MPRNSFSQMQMWLTATLMTMVDRVAAAAKKSEDDDRGDVPGWVMITVMTVRLRPTLH